MTKIITVLFFTLISSTFAYSDNGNGNNSDPTQAIKMQMQQLVEIDRQIEGLVEQRLKLKAEIAAHLERGSTGLLPGVGRRQSREAGSEMQDMQGINQQIEQLEMKRQAIMAGQQ